MLTHIVHPGVMPGRKEGALMEVWIPDNPHDSPGPSLNSKGVALFSLRAPV